MIGHTLNLRFGDTANYLMLVTGLGFAAFAVSRQVDDCIEAPERPQP